MALILPVLMLERFTLEMPTYRANWLREIFRSAITRSRRKIIGTVSPHRVVSASVRSWQA